MKNINWSNELTIKESWVQINNKSSTMSYFVTGYKNKDGSEITVWEGEKVTIEDENGNEKIGELPCPTQLSEIASLRTGHLVLTH